MINLTQVCPRVPHHSPEKWALAIGRFFAAGVKLVWVLDPDARTVTSHEPGKPVTTFALTDTLVTDWLPGFAVTVAKLFSNL